jgi:D-alanyl-D-alanine carboxypeptidase
VHVSRAARALRALATAPFLVAGLLLAPLGSPPPVAGIGPLPACEYKDVMTSPRGFDDWAITLVDTALMVGNSYRPRDLVPISQAGIAGGGSVREVAIDDLRALGNAARANGTPVANLSAFRGYRQQVNLFNGYVEAYGYEEAITFSARPGHSEHQLGLTIDFMTEGGPSSLAGDWATTPAGRWMKNNAWKFGWLMSYPKGKMAVTCYSYEPWHYRYVGRALAKEIHDSGLTTREYLWANFTMIDPVTGSPIPSETPTPELTPTPTVAPTPALSLAPTGPVETPVPSGPPT